MFNNIEFANPGFLYLLIIIPLMGIWYWYKLRTSHPALQVSSRESFPGKGKSIKQYLYHILFVFRILAVALLILTLARPQSSLSRKDVSIEGIDISYYNNL